MPAPEFHQDEGVARHDFGLQIADARFEREERRVEPSLVEPAHGEMCIRAHEKVVLEGGLTEDHVHDAVRLAATLQGAAVALEIADVEPRPLEMASAAAV